MPRYPIEMAIDAARARRQSQENNSFANKLKEGLQGVSQGMALVDAIQQGQQARKERQKKETQFQALTQNPNLQKRALEFGVTPETMANTIMEGGAAGLKLLKPEESTADKMQAVMDMTQQQPGSAPTGATPEIGVNLGGVTAKIAGRQPIYMQTPGGKIINQSTGKEVKSLPTDAFVTKQGKKPVSIEKETQETEAHLESLKILEQMAESIPGLEESPGRILLSQLSRGIVSPEIKDYMDKTPAMSAGWYRSVTGDKRLSDVDAQMRAKPLVWTPTESVKLRKMKFNFLKQLFATRIRLLKKGKFDVDEFGQAIIPFSTLMSNTAGHNELKNKIRKEQKEIDATTFSIDEIDAEINKRGGQ